MEEEDALVRGGALALLAPGRPPPQGQPPMELWAFGVAIGLQVWLAWAGKRGGAAGTRLGWPPTRPPTWPSCERLCFACFLPHSSKILKLQMTWDLQYSCAADHHRLAPAAAAEALQEWGRLCKAWAVRCSLGRVMVEGSSAAPPSHLPVRCLQAALAATPAQLPAALPPHAHMAPAGHRPGGVLGLCHQPPRHGSPVPTPRRAGARAAAGAAARPCTAHAGGWVLAGVLDCLGTLAVPPHGLLDRWVGGWGHAARRRRLCSVVPAGLPGVPPHLPFLLTHTAHLPTQRRRTI